MTRRLSPEESSLWNQVARTAKRLRRRKEPEAQAVAAPATDKRGDTTSLAKLPATAEPRLPRRSGPPAPQTLDRRSIHRLGRGAIAIDGRIDLHGSTQAEAHERLRGYLALAQSSGGRVVLVITGKGMDEGDRGVLRRAVPHWLSSPSFRPLVSGYGEAHRTHGGSGALYVRIRRPR